MVDWGFGLKIEMPGVRFLLMVMCTSVGQTSHSILPLPTQQFNTGYLVELVKKLDCNDWL